MLLSRINTNFIYEHETFDNRSATQILATFKSPFFLFFLLFLLYFFIFLLTANTKQSMRVHVKIKQEYGGRTKVVTSNAMNGMNTK
jgi:hypothetical protein